jgi:hypothetical protein
MGDRQPLASETRKIASLQFDLSLGVPDQRAAFCKLEVHSPAGAVPDDLYGSGMTDLRERMKKPEED